MEKRNINFGKSIIEKDELEEISQVEPEPPAGVWLRSNFPGILNVIGSATGKRYTWNGGGSVVQVDAQDAPNLLTKTFGGYSCCSGAGPTPKFVVVN